MLMLTTILPRVSKLDTTLEEAKVTFPSFWSVKSKHFSCSSRSLVYYTVGPSSAEEGLRGTEAMSAAGDPFYVVKE